MIKQLQGIVNIAKKTIETKKGGKELLKKASETVDSVKKKAVQPKKQESLLSSIVPKANAAPLDNEDPEFSKMMRELDQINQKEYGKPSIFQEGIRKAESEGDTEYANMLRDLEKLKDDKQTDQSEPPKPRTIADFLLGGTPEELQAKAANLPEEKSFLDRFLVNLNPQTYIDKSFAPTLSALTGGASEAVGEKVNQPVREINRAATNFVASQVEGIGNIANFLSSRPEDRIKELLIEKGFSEEEANKMTGGPSVGKKIQEGASSLGTSIRESGTEATQIPNESISGGVGDIAGLVFGAGKLGKIAKTEQITAKAAPQIIKGTENLGSKLFSGNSGYAADKARNVLNFIGNNADKMIKSGARNVAETNLASIFSNGEAASKEDLVFATGLQAIPALAQYKLKQKAMDRYKSAIKMFSGSEESVEKFNNKVWKAIESGYVGKNADEIYKKTLNDIKAGNKKVGEALKKTTLKVRAEDIWEEGHKLIEELSSSGQFDKVKPIETALKEITGDKFKSTLAEVANQISKVDEKIANAKSKAEVEEFILKKSKLLEKFENAKKKKSFIPSEFDAEKLWELKKRGRERNINIVKGKEVQTTKDAAVNQLWLRLGSKATNILNSQIEEFKRLGDQLNIAHLVNDATAALSKKGSVVTDPGKTLFARLLPSKPLKQTVKAKRGQHLSDLFGDISKSKLSKVGAVNLDNEIQSNTSNAAQGLINLIQGTVEPVLDTTATVGTNLVKLLSPEVRKLFKK